MQKMCRKGVSYIFMTQEGGRAAAAPPVCRVAERSPGECGGHAGGGVIMYTHACSRLWLWPESALLLHEQIF